MVVLRCWDIITWNSGVENDREFCDLDGRTYENGSLRNDMRKIPPGTLGRWTTVILISSPDFSATPKIRAVACFIWLKSREKIISNAQGHFCKLCRLFLLLRFQVVNGCWQGKTPLKKITSDWTVEIANWNKATENEKSQNTGYPPPPGGEVGGSDFGNRPCWT